MPHFNTELGRGQFGVVYATDSDWHVRPEGAKIAIKALVPANDRQWGDLAQEYFYMHYWMKGTGHEGSYPSVKLTTGGLHELPNP